MFIHINHRDTVDASGVCVLDNPDAVRNANSSLFSDAEESQQQKKKAKLDLLQELITNFDDKKLESLTVAHLKTLANKQSVNIRGMTKKRDIIQALKTHHGGTNNQQVA